MFVPFRLPCPPFHQGDWALFHSFTAPNDNDERMCTFGIQAPQHTNLTALPATTTLSIIQEYDDADAIYTAAVNSPSDAHHDHVRSRVSFHYTDDYNYHGDDLSLKIEVSYDSSLQLVPASGLAAAPASDLSQCTPTSISPLPILILKG